MKKKSLIMLLCAVLVVSSVAMGTIAYLTSSTSVTNTFTVGKVNIDLDEAIVNKDGQPVDENGDGVANDRTNNGNEYHLVPGKTYTKDPTVTVKAGSEESYVRMIVHITDQADVIDVFGVDFKLEDIVEGFDSTKWKPVNKVITDDTIDYEFRYHQPVSTMNPAEDKVLEPLFTKFTVPGKRTGEELEKIADMKIIVEGHAIQTATFTAADYEGDAVAAENAAWTAFHAQTTSNN